MASLHPLASLFPRISFSSSSSSSFLGSIHFFMLSPHAPPSLPHCLTLPIEAAHKKGAGSTKNGRDSKGKRLGVKIYGDQAAQPGAIIIRQRGTKFHPGNNVGLGRDYTIFSLIHGLVRFEKFGPDRKKVSVYPMVEVPENSNSRKVRRREFYRARREERRKLEELFVGDSGIVVAPA